MRRILITSDLHFERIEVGYINLLYEHISKVIESIKPEIFCIAGDTTDDSNLRAETEEFKNLVTFIDLIAKTCRDNNVAFVVLRGTPSHDGNIMKNIHGMLSNFIYIDSMCNMDIKGIKCLFVPEMYYPTYDEFKSDLNKLEYSDILIFHGMMDFAIPQLQQIDSKFNVGRSVVITSKDFQNKVKYCVVGGHVHDDISFENIHYTNRIINERGHSHERGYGLKLVELSNDSYTYTKIDNPHLIKHNYIILDFTNMDVDTIVARSKDADYNNTIFGVTLDDSEMCKSRYRTWRENIPALYIKKKKIKNKVHEEIKTTNKYDRLGVQDVELLLKDTYKEMYKTDIPEDILSAIIKGEQNEY